MISVGVILEDLAFEFSNLPLLGFWFLNRSGLLVLNFITKMENFTGFVIGGFCRCYGFLLLS
jgi:hypothetical protein